MSSIVKQQRLWLEMMLSSPDLFSACNTVMKPAYFAPELNQAVEFIQEYHLIYNAVPHVDVVSANCDLELKERVVTPDMREFVMIEVERTCRQSGMRAAVLQAAQCLEEVADNPEQTDLVMSTVENIISDAARVALPKQRGMNFFRDSGTVLRKSIVENTYISTGWADVDEVLGGGLNRKTMVLFSAGPGGGKSITMQNLLKNLVAQGLKGIYFSLELSEELINERFVTLYTEISKRVMKEHIEEAIESVAMQAADNGEFSIVQFPSGACANDFKQYIDNNALVEGWFPDFIVIDYLDLMSPNDKRSVDGVFEKDKRISEDVRNLSFEYNMVSITASQLNRSAVGETQINHSMIAGGMSKINTTDIYIAVIMTDIMKAQGKMLFDFQKTRTSDGVGTILNMEWGKSFMYIRCLPDTDPNRIQMPGEAPPAPTGMKGPRQGFSSPESVVAKGKNGNVSLDDILSSTQS